MQLIRSLSAAAAVVGVAVFLFLSRPIGASVGTVQFSTSPALSPAFNPAVQDYVVRCSDNVPIQVSVSNSDGADVTTTVSVDGQSPKPGAFAAQVSVLQGQGFKVAAAQGAAATTYYVRCLPNGFPTWGSQRPGIPQAEYYIVVPVPSTGVGIANRYISMYDTNGVPIWWTRPENPLRPWDAKLLSNLDILWTESDNNTAIRGLKAEERRLDGSIVDNSIAPSGFQLDAHETQRLSNGNYLVTGGYGKCCYNLSSHGGPTSATIRDDIVQEITPGGSPLWTWYASDHIGLDEVQSQWWTTIMPSGSPYDVFHMNSAVTDAGHNLLISIRYANAVYKVVDPAGPVNAGAIAWKLGGSVPPLAPATRLAVSGDPVFTAGGGFGGQHYAHYFDAGDGKTYVTLHDNGTGRGRAPRGVRYRIDEQAMTATLVEDVRDTASPNMTAACCGSAGKLPTGNWVMSWGANPLMTELTPSGARAFALTFSASSYRVDPVMPGVLTRELLRAGMDAQYPRIVNGTPTANPQSVGTAEDTPIGITLTGSDPESQPLTFATLASPAHGSLSGSGPNRTYTPQANYHGADSFTFTVNDGLATSSAATVNIAVSAAPDAPVASNTSASTKAGTPVSLTLSATDADGDSLTYTVITGPASGSLSGSGASRSYSPNAGFVGSDSFTFRANDGTLNSNLATVSISVTAVTAGALSGSFATPTSTQDLSALGTLDWAHWGLTTSTSFNHKAGITSKISNVTGVGFAFTSRHTTHPFGFTWTGGTPTAGVAGTTTGLLRSATGGGFRFTVPAGLTQQTLRVFVGARSGAVAKLVAALSDGSAPAYTDTSLTSGGTAGRVYTLVYKAGSGGQTLTVTFTRNNGAGSVTVEGAALAP